MKGKKTQGQIQIDAEDKENRFKREITKQSCEARRTLHADARIETFSPSKCLEKCSRVRKVKREKVKWKKERKRKEKERKKREKGSTYRSFICPLNPKLRLLQCFN